MSIKTKPARITMHLQGIRTICFDFGPLLQSGVTLSGTPVVTADPSPGLTIGSPTVNGSTFTDLDGSTTVAASEGVQVKLTPVTAGVYTLTARCGLSTSGEREALELEVEVLGR